LTQSRHDADGACKMVRHRGDKTTGPRAARRRALARPGTRRGLRWTGRPATAPVAG